MFPSPEYRLAILILLLSFILSACGGAPAPGPGVQPGPRPTNAGPSDVTLARSTKQRQASPDVADAALSELAAGNTAFALDLYQAIQGQDGNLFYSPYSISLALAMTYAGARGETERQMADTLHFALPQEQLHPAFNALDLQLTQQDQGEDAFKLKVANSLWGQKDFAFRPEFLDLLAENYGAGLRLVDFMDESAREQARLTINKWVEEQTEDKIKELLKQGILTQDTRLVLANAIYFKAEWEQPFLNGTKEEPFTLLDGTQVTAPTMSRRAMTRYAGGEDYQAVEIAYKGGRMSMVVFLPAPGQFEAFEASLDAERINAILQGLKQEDIRLFMPKFKYEAELSLAQTLADRGMPDAFDPLQADFSGMTGKRNLFIKHVEHKAFVAVDELGTEAAAATGIVSEIVSMPIEVRVDRPFIFLIRDGETGAILFVGRVVDPRA